MTARIEAGSIILSPADAAILYQVLDVKRARDRNRVGQKRVYDLLTELSICAFSEVAASGNEPRQDAAREEREWWTVHQIYEATRGQRSERTIRLDCQTGALPARKTPTWLVSNKDATTYIAAHRR